MKVDLDALAKDLTNAGFTCTVDDDMLYADFPKKKNHIERRYCVNERGHIFLGQRRWGEWDGCGLILTTDWPHIDLIRKHLTEEPS